jgi:hypothetical protein
MTAIQTASIELPLDLDTARRAAHLVVSAEAMGILDEAEGVRRLDLAGLRAVLQGIAAAGVATSVVRALDGSDTLEPEELSRALDAILEALEASPLPELEWEPLLRLFGAEALAELLNVSASSLHRYARGTRPTPDEVAERLHFLARVVGDLKGAYNDIGIRRWCQRKRSLLGNRSPASLLRGNWSPDHRGAQRVRALARSLAFADAT